MADNGKVRNEKANKILIFVIVNTLFEMNKIIALMLIIGYKI